MQGFKVGEAKSVQFSASIGLFSKALAYHVLEEINRVSSVTPTALVGC